MNLMDRFHAQARRRPMRIVYPEGHDDRIRLAASEIQRRGIAEPILLGDAAAECNGLARIDIRADARREHYARTYAQDRNVKVSLAERLIRKPLAFGGMMVRLGDADGMVAGIDSPTASVIQAASLTIGYSPGSRAASSLFLMVIPSLNGVTDAVLVFADCAVVVQPDADGLAEIAVNTALTARALLDIEPRVAFLSFSTRGSAAHADIDKVTTALEIARRRCPDIAFDGELQGDAALAPRVAVLKAPSSPVAGRANVLIFPDLDAGNIGYKLTQYLAGAQAVGPILQGFDRPVNDLSRGAQVEDIVNVTAITVVQAQQFPSNRKGIQDV